MDHSRQLSVYISIISLQKMSLQRKTILKITSTKIQGYNEKYLSHVIFILKKVMQSNALLQGGCSHDVVMSTIVI